MKNLLIVASLKGILFSSNRPYVVVLGIAQDGGLPHAGCDKTCCKGLWETNEGEKVSYNRCLDFDKKVSYVCEFKND